MLVRLIILWWFLAMTAAGQAPSLNAARSGCRGAQPRVYAELPAAMGATTVMVPVCLQLGAMLAIDTSTNPPTLNSAMVQQQTPWLAVDRIDLASLPADGGPTLTWTLGQVPMEGSALLAVLQGRPYGLVEAAVVSGRQVNITLPARPFAAGDLVVLVYLTLDMRPPAPVRR